MSSIIKAAKVTNVIKAGRKNRPLLKHLTDFTGTQFAHGNRTASRLHRGDLYRLRFQASGGRGGNGYEPRNQVGGYGGNIKLVATRSANYDNLEKVKSSFLRNIAYQEKVGHLKLSKDKELDEIKESQKQHNNTFKLRGGKGEAAGKFKTGLKGKDVTFTVPLGTEIFEDLMKKVPHPNYPKDFPNRYHKKFLDTVRIGSLEIPDQTFTIAHGGEPGNFTNGYKGDKGEQRRIFIIVRENADLAIVGMANSGKTSLLQQLTGRRKHSLISSGSNTTTGIQKGMIKFEDGVHCSVIDTPNLCNINDFMLKKTIFRAKSLLLLVDPFGSQEDYDSPFYTALETIQLFEEIVSEHYSEQKELKFVLAFNKLDLPGAQQKMEEVLTEYNAQENRLNFEKVLAISADKNLGIQPIHEFTRETADGYYMKYIAGRDHKLLQASGTKWPPPSLKGPNAAVLTEKPREYLLKEEFGKPHIGGSMMEFGDKKLKNPRQAFSNFIENKRLEVKEERRAFIEKKQELEIQKEYLAGGYSEEQTYELLDSAQEEVKRLESKYGQNRVLEAAEAENIDLKNLDLKNIDFESSDLENLKPDPESIEKVASLDRNSNDDTSKPILTKQTRTQ